MADTLLVKLGLDAGEYTSGLKNASRQADEFQASIVKASAVAGAALVAAAAGFIRMVQEQAKAIDEFNDLRDATGATIENISALDRVARETGESFGTVSTTLLRFNKALGDADKAGSNADRIFKALGLDAAELKRLDPAEALRQTAVALGHFANDGEKARAVQELFGKSIKDAAPFLNDLASKTALVGTVSTEAAAEVEKFNKEMYQAQAAATDFARSVSIDVVTGLNAVIQRFRDGRFDIIEFHKEMAKAAITAASFGQIKFRSAADENYGNEGRGSLDRNENYGNEGRGIRSLRISTPAEKTKRAKAPTESEAQRYLEQLQREVEAVNELSREERVLADIREGRIKGLTPAIEQQLKDWALFVDLEKERAAATKATAAAEADAYTVRARTAEAATDTAANLEAQNQAYREETEVLGLSGEALRAVEKARVSSQIAIKEEELALRQSRDECDELTYALERQIEALRARSGLISTRGSVEEMQRTKKEAEDFNDALKEDFADAFAGFIDGSKSASEAFASFANSVVANMARIASQRLAESIFNSASGSGGWLSALSSYFSSGSSGAGMSGAGGVNAGYPAYGLATGTNYVPYDGMRAVLHKGEAVVPAAYNPAIGGKGGGNVYINNSSPAKVSAEKDENGDWRVAVEDAARGAVISDIRRGGRTATAMASTYGLNRAAGTPRRK